MTFVRHEIVMSDVVDGMRKRSSQEHLSATVYPRFMDWVRNDRIIDMFDRGGEVNGPGGQEPWIANAPSTVRRKGHDAPLLGIGGPVPGANGTLSGSYVIGASPTHNGYRFTMENDAVSEEGFDYPSLQHFGGGKNRLPARPHVNFLGPDVRYMLRGILDEIFTT